MCGRFFVDGENPQIKKLIEELSEPVKTGEVFPTNTCLIIRRNAEAFMPAAMTWGFPHWQGKGSIINVRSETALSKPIFASSLREHPVVIPTNGFFEWKNKEKYLFTNPDSKILYLAVFWKKYQDKQGKSNPYFSILTTDAVESISGFNDRMPLTLTDTEIDDWLNGDIELLQKIPFDCQVSIVN